MKVTLIVALVVALMAGRAFAQGPMDGGMPHGGGHAGGGHPGGGQMMHGGGGMGGGFGPQNLMAFRMMMERLDLTEDQKEEIEEILTEVREDMILIYKKVGLMKHR